MVENTTARQVIFTVLIFSAIVSGGFSIIAMSIPTTDINSDFNTKYNTTINKFQDIQTHEQNMIDAARDKGLIGNLVNGGWGVLTLTWDSLDTFSTLAQEIPIALGLPIPFWFFALISGFLFITVVFAFLAAIFHWFL